MTFYRRVFHGDLQMDGEEAAELKQFLSNLNPPPDKILWMRATAFRIASEFLTAPNTGDESSSSADRFKLLLKTVNCIVHAIETNCLEPKPPTTTDGEDEDDSEWMTIVSEFYRAWFQEYLSMDKDNDEDGDNKNGQEKLQDFFKSNWPKTVSSLTKIRFLAFKVANEYSITTTSTEDKQYLQLLKGLNAVVHALEITCFRPKPLHLKPSEQQPAGVVDVSNMTLNEAVQHLWNLDDNRLDPKRDYTINVQEGKKPYWKEDVATDPLFSYVNPSILQQRPTYRTFVALLDNYTPHTGQQEEVTRAEEDEIKAFLHAVMQTKPMQFCHHYCHKKKDSIPSDTAGFVRWLHQVWFELYRRERGQDSCGFEHVFVGEIKNGQVSGFHNWIQFYLQERKGTLDYRGYIKPRSSSSSDSDDGDHLLTLQFNWHGVMKQVGSSFIGVSPEFEMALYTMCFATGESVNPVQLSTGSGDVFELEIVCYPIANDKIGTSYPDIKNQYEE